MTGIELSADMLAELRGAPGSARIHAVEGDMATTRVEGEFSLVYLVFNTITNLTTQDEQVACFENAARHLVAGGRFVIENGIPSLRRLPPGAVGVPFGISDDYIGIDDFIDRTHLQISRSRIAGLTLEHRWAGWDCSPFTGDSPSHVSVWS